MKPSDTGPQRKYYSLTNTGAAEKNEFIVQWHNLKNSVDNLIKGSELNENE